jgi:AAA lid domain
MTTEIIIDNIPIDNELSEFNIEYINIVTNTDDSRSIAIKHSDLDKELVCVYAKRGKDTATNVKTTLVHSGFEDKQAKKFVALLLKRLMRFEQKKRQTQRDHILEQIRERRKKTNIKTVEQWKIELKGKYNTLKQVIEDNIPEIWIGLEFELSVLRILNIHGNTLPFIGIILARPGGGKTQILRVLGDWYCVYHIDDFSPRSFVSHNSSFSDDELRDRIDMLPQIKNKLFQTPELGTLFTTKEEDLNKSLGTIVRIADGHGYANSSGAHGRRGYDEDVMFVWIGAVVEIPYKVYKLLGTLGFKMYFFRLPYKKKTKADVLDNMGKDYNKNIDSIKSALTEYLYLFEMGPGLIYDNELNKMPWNSMRDDPVAKEYIAELAMLLQHLRCIVTTWDNKSENYNSDYDYTVSMPEDPDRAAIALFNLAKGHALLTGRNYITMEDIPIVVKTVLSTAKIDRVGLLYLLMEKGDTWLSTDVVMDALGIARSTALRTMKEFDAIGIVETHERKAKESDTQNTKYIILRKEFRWLTQNKFTELREGFIPVDNRNFLSEQKKANFTDQTPQGRAKSIDVKPEQVDTFLKLFDEMVEQQVDYPSEIDRDTISGETLRKRLVQSGKFKDNDDAAMIIEGMQKFRMIERVSLDTYRRSKK